MEIVLIFAIICGVVGYLINGGTGAILGAMFGPFGLIIAAVLKGQNQ